MSSNSTQLAKGFKLLNPGLLDSRQGPYPTLEAACLAIPDVTKLINGVNVNYRDGLIVYIGLNGNYSPHWWNGGFNDENLVAYINTEVIDSLPKKKTLIGASSIIPGIESSSRTYIFDSKINESLKSNNLTIHVSVEGDLFVKRFQSNGLKYIFVEQISVPLHPGKNSIDIFELLKYENGDYIGIYTDCLVHYNREITWSSYRTSALDENVVSDKTINTLGSGASNIQVNFVFDTNEVAVLSPDDIVNNLLGGIGKALSAEQGRELKILLDDKTDKFRSFGNLSPTTGTDSGTRTYLFTTPISSDTTLRKVRVFCLTDGDLYIKRFSFSTSGLVYEYKGHVVVPVLAGYNKLEIPGFDFKKGEIIAVYSTAKMTYTNSQGWSTYRYTSPSANYLENLTIANQTPGSLNIQVGFEFEINTASIAPNEIGDIWVGDNLVSFVGDDFRIYLDSLFSGWLPMQNFQIRVDSYNSVVLNGDKGNFCFLDTSKAYSNGTITINVVDTKGITIAKKNALVKVKEKPTTLAGGYTVTNKMKVLCTGDSLFHNNGNEIGRELLRMLTTDQNTESVVSGVVLKPTLNIAPGAIELVGRHGDISNKWSTANKFSVIMTGKDGASTAFNPYYNPNSTQPDEIGADGYNKRVDFEWYFQEICGAGKFPNIIYLACGVNDIVELGWDEASLPVIQNKLVLFLSKVKSACDNIAGGNSNVKVLILNHQFYPLNRGHYSDFDVWKARRLWVKHYNGYNNVIKTRSTTNGAIALSSFVRLIDCSSQFDTKHGYEYNTVRANPRTSITEEYPRDTVHMGKGGAYQYADALIRDFLYYECI